MIASAATLQAVLRPARAFRGGGKQKGSGETLTDVDISRQTQRVKDLPHGLANKQIRMMLKADLKFYRKVERTQNEEHLTTCILAEAKRLGLQTMSASHNAAHPPLANIAPCNGKGKGESPSWDPSPNQKGKGKGKHTHQEDSNAKGSGPKNKGKGKGSNFGSSTLTDNKTSKSKGKGKPEAPTRPTFEVVPEGWNVLPAQHFDGSQGGIFAIENEDAAKKLAEAAAHCPFPVGILAPQPVDVGIGAPRPVHVEFFQCKDGQKHVVTLHTYLHQLTQHEVTYTKNARAVQINRPSVARTQVVYVRFTDQGASAQTRLDLQDKKPFQAKAWVQSLLNTSKPVQIHDTWNVQEQGIANGVRYYSMSMRVPSDVVPDVLTASMPGRIQTNIPAHLRSELSHVWLKTPAGPMNDEDVKATLANCPIPHLGCFQLRGTWALRVRSDKLRELKQHLGRNTAPAYFVYGAAADMDAADVHELCKQVNWHVTVANEDCRWKRGGPIWLVRADAQPSILAFPLNYGYERLQIQIVPAAKPVQTAGPKQAPSLQPPTYSSWHAQMRGTGMPLQTKHIKPTFKEILQQGGPPIKKPKTVAAPIPSQAGSATAAPAKAPAAQQHAQNLLHSPLISSPSNDREQRLEAQLNALQQTNAAQQQQIAQLLEQITQLTQQLQALTAHQALHTPVPPEPAAEDAKMEGGGDS